MNLCILSGKGGTGKTTLAVNLALVTGADYFDCDVEEPNGFLFLHPQSRIKEETQVDYPVIDESKCTLCGECAKACRFNALAVTKKSALLFPTLCHGCHACEIVCAPGAISYAQRPVGIVETGERNGIRCAQGVLHVGEHMAVPVIGHLLQKASGIRPAILDCAPGSSCNVVHTLRHAGAAVVVTEPTVFGLHDMRIAVALLERMELPFGVVINKSGAGDGRIEDFCTQNHIRILGRIPYSREAAVRYSNGQMLCEMPGMQPVFEQIAASCREAFSWNWPY